MGRQTYDVSDTEQLKLESTGVNWIVRTVNIVNNKSWVLFAHLDYDVAEEVYISMKNAYIKASES